MDAKMYHIVANDRTLRSKQDIYRYLAEYTDPTHSKEIQQLLEEREQVGDLQIAPHVLLPHIENAIIKESYIVIIKLNEPITWNEQIKDISFVIALMLNPEESRDYKKEVIKLMHKLADDEWLADWITQKTKETIWTYLNKK